MAVLRLMLMLLLVEWSTAQLSSVQVDKIEMFPNEPRPGESVKIRCYLKNVDPTKPIKPDIIWSFRSINTDAQWRIIGNGASVSETFNNRLTGRKESDEVYEIVFRPIQENDAGFIKCELTNSEGQIFKIQELYVYSAPYITYITPDLYTKLGNKVTLECHAEGYPKPTVRWSRQGSLTAVLSNPILEIMQVTREDRGTYKCYVENVTPINKIKQSAEAFVTLTIDFPPTIKCDANVMHQVPDINADAEVTCIVEGYPLTSVKWYFSPKDEHMENEINTNQYFKIETIESSDLIKSLLVIRNVNREHFGAYTIKAEGSSQQIVERTIMLEPVINIDTQSVSFLPLSASSSSSSSEILIYDFNLLLVFFSFISISI